MFSRMALLFPQEEPCGSGAERVPISLTRNASTIAHPRHSAGKLCHPGPCPPGSLSGKAPPGSLPQPLPAVDLEAALALGCQWVHMAQRSASERREAETVQPMLTACMARVTPPIPDILGTEARVAAGFKGRLLKCTGRSGSL